MLKFRTWDDVLDFAILQEKAAGQFYTKLSGEMNDSQVCLYCRTMAEEENVHEKELRRLKSKNYALPEVNLKMLRESGYLDALPAPPEMTLREAMELSLKKERSARALYSLMAASVDDPELKKLFQMLSEQEQIHADYFQKELEQETVRTK